MFYPVKNVFLKEDISKNWSNWIWQEQNSIQTVSRLLELFPYLPEENIRAIRQSEKIIRFKVTPYMLSMIKVDDSLRPIPDDPIWNQFIPNWDVSLEPFPNVEAFKENWELPEDMINPILQHKYENRVNFRIQNRCLAYCMYCFEAKRVLNKDPIKQSFSDEYFMESLEYIKTRPEVEEVVISGGEPLVLHNEKLNYILRKIREIEKIKAIRIQTHAFVHNPFRIDDELIKLLIKYDVTAIGIHISHPVEITDTFRNIIEKISKHCCRTILLAQIPLLKGINDEKNILIELFMELYKHKIMPYYLLHSMPYTLGSSKYRTSVRRGVELMRSIKRNISNPCIPEYVIVHVKGKHTVPLELQSTPEFQYVNGKVKFLNWKGEWCYYEDYPDYPHGQN